MGMLASRDWVPANVDQFIQSVAQQASTMSVDDIDQRIAALIKKNRKIHEQDCFNLNPATNVVNPKAEAVLGQGLGSRPSLGYPGVKYEMGLEAIEEIEIYAAELAAEVFGAQYAEIRVGSGALANLYAFMAVAKAGDTIIVPSPEIGGHVTHHQAGAAGLYGLNIHSSAVDAEHYTVDLDQLRDRKS